MPLEISADEPGLWINPDLQAQGAGVHALIIGVSRFDHLKDGQAPAPETYGLTQLSVSALTAYRFFLWLRDAYSLEGWPIARVRLLMSPQRKGIGAATKDELDAGDAAICAHAPEATFENCKRALANWYVDMEALQTPACGRSLFLYSGHGMERRQNYQLLLPCDYLKPRGHLINDLLSTPNISDALSYLSRVSSHILLLDGCRNDIDKLRGASGSKILNDDQTVPINPLFEKAALFATSSGLRAYSPRSGSLSLFGQALLDGLHNKPQPPLDEPPLELVRRGRVATVEVNKLASYMKGRVAALIKAANESVVQIVRSEVSSPQPGQPIELVEFPLPASSLARPPGPPEPIDFSIDATHRGPSAPTRKPAPKQDSWFLDRYGPAKKASVAKNGRSLSDQVSRLHTLFGSEAVTFPWLESLRVIGLSSQKESDHNTVQILSSAQAEKTKQLHSVQITFSLNSQDAVGHALLIQDQSGRRSSCVLPSDSSRRIFALEIDVEDDEFIRFSAHLSPTNGGLTGSIAAAWDQLRASDALSAIEKLKLRDEKMLNTAFELGEEVLRDKLRAPWAATVAALLLLKGNEFTRMHDWARNLANWFPTIPDGVVLWIEQCRRESARKLDSQLVEWFVSELSKRSLPFTSDAFGLASDLVSDILRQRVKADSDTRERALGLAQRLDRAAPYFRDTGLFCTYSGFAEDWNPALMLAPPQPKDAPKSKRAVRKKPPKGRKRELTKWRGK